MPFKTRRQKAQAEKRFLEFIETQQFNYNSLKNSNKVNREEIKGQTAHNIKSQTQDAIENSHPYVKRELVKITALASIIIGLQIILRVFDHSI